MNTLKTTLVSGLVALTLNAHLLMHKTAVRMGKVYEPAYFDTIRTAHGP